MQVYVNRWLALIGSSHCVSDILTIFDIVMKHIDSKFGMEVPK